jgi:hypothetical protein
MSRKSVLWIRVFPRGRTDLHLTVSFRNFANSLKMLLELEAFSLDKTNRWKCLDLKAAHSHLCPAGISPVKRHRLLAEHNSR